jgi:glycosyltransferase involved in cell wall biosynthesis
MPLPPAILLALLVPLAASAIALAIYWFVVLLRIAETTRRLPTGLDGVALAEARTEPDPSVLVVVPAHNEAGSIAPLIRSLREQDHPRFHVALALDRCTDGTAAVARREAEGDHRIEIIEIDECPDGWAGKVNAVRTAVERSAFTPEADYFLFTDADCVLHPSCLRAAAALAADRSLDLLSFLSEYPAESWFELVVQPTAGFELMRQYPLLRANRFDDRQRPFANGQFMLFRAEHYRAIGGHAVARDELLEDLALARAVKRQGGRAGALLGGGIVRCRMYESWAEFRRGWKRIYTEAAQRRSSRLREAAWRLLLLSVLLPALVLVLGVASAAVMITLGAPPAWFAVAAGLVALGIGPVLLCMGRINRMALVPATASLAAPLGAWLVSRVLFAAARELSTGKPTVWAGRAYHREDRSRAPASPKGGAA